MILDFFYVTLIVFAILAIQANILRNAIIYLSVFSLLCSAVYLFLGAPDVAIAEAVIGCTLSTILYLVALKKYKILTVYYRYIPPKTVTSNTEPSSPLSYRQENDKIKEVLNDYVTEHDLQLDFINTQTVFKKITESSFDMIIFHTSKGLFLHGLHNNYQYLEMAKSLQENISLPITLFYLNEEEEESDDA